jgi:hypothetical protein
MTEREYEQARLIAEAWLNFKMNSLVQIVPGNPDCDTCVLARQFLRALEQLDTEHEVETGRCLEEDQERHSS